MIQSTIQLVPDGVVVFLPSYAFLDKVKAVWTKSGLMTRFGERKQVNTGLDVFVIIYMRQVFYEPQTSSDVEAILRDYSLAISSVSQSLLGSP